MQQSPGICMWKDFPFSLCSIHLSLLTQKNMWEMWWSCTCKELLKSQRYLPKHMSWKVVTLFGTNKEFNWRQLKGKHDAFFVSCFCIQPEECDLSLLCQFTMTHQLFAFNQLIACSFLYSSPGNWLAIIFMFTEILSLLTFPKGHLI